MIDAMHRPGSMSSFRSDGNSGGIWDSVELVARPRVYVDHVKLFTRIGIRKDRLGDGRDRPDGTALVSADVTVHSTTGDVVETDLLLEVPALASRAPNHTGAAGGSSSSRERTTAFVLTIRDARLWWTWDHGDPNLYTAT